MSTASGSRLPYKVRARVENTGGADANSVVVSWESPLGLRLAEGDRSVKPIGPLYTGEALEVTWHIEPIRRPNPYFGNLPFSVKGEIAGVEREFRANGFLDIPSLDSELRIEPVRGESELRPGDYLLVRIVARNVPQFLRRRNRSAL